MKRSRLGPGKKSRERGSTFKRPDWRKNNPTRRGAQGRKNPLSRGWTQRVFMLYGARCLVCAKRAVQAHHVIPRQTVADAAHLDSEQCLAFEYDARNGLPICLSCHTDHENPGCDSDEKKRIRRGTLRTEHIEWARDHGFEVVLDRIYGPGLR